MEKYTKRSNGLDEKLKKQSGIKHTIIFLCRLTIIDHGALFLRCEELLVVASSGGFKFEGIFERSGHSGSDDNGVSLLFFNESLANERPVSPVLTFDEFDFLIETGPVFFLLLLFFLPLLVPAPFFFFGTEQFMILKRITI